jgi:hypothetical protein
VVFAPGSTVVGKVRFSQLVLDQPKAALTVLVEIGNGKICFSTNATIAKGPPVRICTCILQLKALVEFTRGQAVEIGLEAPQDPVRLRMEQDGQKQVGIGRLGAGHVMEEVVGRKGKSLLMLPERVPDRRIEQRQGILGDGSGKQRIQRHQFTASRFEHPSLSRDMFPFPVDKVDLQIDLELVQIS